MSDIDNLPVDQSSLQRYKKDVVLFAISLWGIA
jgi:hypothetical protein